jgi:hypothetical protein
MTACAPAASAARAFWAQKAQGAGDTIDMSQTKKPAPIQNKSAIAVQHISAAATQPSAAAAVGVTTKKADAAPLAKSEQGEYLDAAELADFTLQMGDRLDDILKEAHKERAVPIPADQAQVDRVIRGEMFT